MSVIKVAVVGAAIIGRTHIETLGSSDSFALSAIVVPAPGAVQLAADHGVSHFPDIEGLLEAHVADAVIVAALTALICPTVRRISPRVIGNQTRRSVVATISGAFSATGSGVPLGSAARSFLV